METKLNMLAKSVIKNKFWIVEDTDTGEKIGTIQTIGNGSKDVVLVQNKHRTKYPSIKVLTEKHNIKFADMPKKKVANKATTDVYGFPAAHTVFNGIFDVSKNLPIYTKTNKSKSFYAAGYYIINFNGGWVKSFCPKLLTLDRNEYKGPYKTELEMKEQLRLIRK